MPYQYKREPLSDDEVNRLINACETFEKKFVIWNAFYTGLRIRSLGVFRQPLVTMRYGLYARTFTP
jgi:integrase/recombinase XerD